MNRVLKLGALATERCCDGTKELSTFRIRAHGISTLCLWTQFESTQVIARKQVGLRVQMNAITSSILNALRSSSPGSEPAAFSCAGTAADLPHLPGLQVDGYGIVPLPFLGAAAQGLISLCERAPFGKGE